MPLIHRMLYPVDNLDGVRIVRPLIQMISFRYILHQTHLHILPRGRYHHSSSSFLILSFSILAKVVI
jgi:hypothetical protein